MELVKFYVSSIHPVLEYAAPVWHTSTTKKQKQEIEDLQKRVLQIIFPEIGYKEAMEKASLTTLDGRTDHACQRLFESIPNPSHRLHYLLPEVKQKYYNTPSNY